ncbi:MAG: hypothetical protein ACK55I_33175, partial [bacterium]
MLQDAWDHIEVYHLAADWYKFVSKTTYFAILCISIAIVVFAQVESILQFPSRYEIIALSLAGTMMGAYIGFVNPIVKWQQLRLAALTMESHIWMFRTRAVLY